MYVSVKIKFIVYFYSSVIVLLISFKIKGDGAIQEIVKSVLCDLLQPYMYL